MREYHEDIVEKHLQSRCCKFLFFFTINSNRLNITLAHKRSLPESAGVWFGIICLAVRNLWSVWLLPRPRRLDWIRRLLFQLLLSAIFRPATIMAMSAVFPSLIIMYGQNNYFLKLEAEKMASASDSVSRNIEMAERGDWEGGVKMQHNPLKLKVAALSVECQED